MCFTQNKIKRYKIAATEAAAAKIQCIYCGSGSFVGAAMTSVNVRIIYPLLMHKLFLFSSHIARSLNYTLANSIVGCKSDF